VRTRIAPTPSGFLHAGNVRNIRITADHARRLGLELGLRIDDVDASRFRPEYVDDIFRVLEVLGIEWHFGPRDLTDFSQSWSQRARTDYYRGHLDTESLRPHLYACRCSRSRIRGPASGGCPAGCRHKNFPLIPLESALRLHIPAGTRVDVDGSTVDLFSALGDPVMWRRDDLPSYHLVNVVDDHDLAVTHIIRGEDLRPSSALHVHLARLLGMHEVVPVTYIHHPLVTDVNGEKLSKSTLADPRPLTLAEITTS